ncbi:putative short-chain dehydrogenase/reductase [Clathrospora elynae]|uniref:Putative short-chain dehydrogenase/reductase n=1 Tax=Clathrospora elynae TaxID=706981 RepID=A0A6A5SD23_9PLEO|nr:putative short-chain dehydrogenase/reductase [Clathrospora elynae]
MDHQHPSRYPFKGHVALVTGATGGIGKATCRFLASLGCSVGIHYNSDKAGAEELCAELAERYGDAAGAKYHAVKADMGNYDEVRNMHASALEHLGGVNILINNAGTTSGHSGVTSIIDVPIEEFEKTWRVNCGSAYLLTQLSSKSALHGLVHWAASAYAKKGITVNGVAPALISDTKMLPGSQEELAKKIPIGRLGTSDEIADTIGWMVKTGYVTNKIVAVDGGMYAQ